MGTTTPKKHKNIAINASQQNLILKNLCCLRVDRHTFYQQFEHSFDNKIKTRYQTESLSPTQLSQLIDAHLDHLKNVVESSGHISSELREKITRAHLDYAIPSAWVAEIYLLYLDLIHQKLDQMLPRERIDLECAVRKLLLVDMTQQLEKLEQNSQEYYQEQNLLADILINTTLGLSSSTHPEQVFADICHALVEQSHYLSSAWFTFINQPNDPIFPYAGTGLPDLWENLKITHNPHDPLWQAMETGQNIILDTKQNSLPKWCQDHPEIQAIAIFPFSSLDGPQGVGVVMSNVDWYFQRTPPWLFSSFARLGETLLHLKKNQLKDPLTGLPNRILFADRLEQATSIAKRRNRLVGICILDLDNFKEVNDQYGHMIGDQLLKQVAKRLENNLRIGDTLARIGGDEFGILFAELHDVTEADTLGRQALAQIDHPFSIKNHTIDISASLGMTFHPLDDNTPTDLIRHADTALNQAKDAGRHNLRIYESSPLAITGSVNRMLVHFLTALSSNEIEFHYQPKVDMALGTIIGVEALARWRKKDHLSDPEEFIDTVENSPVAIRRLGRYALNRAARQLGLWINAGQEYSIAVNIGALHLLHPGFLNDIDELIRQYPYIRGYLEIEVTERAAIKEMERTRNVLQGCRDRGLTVSLDDYGTGHASLMHLQELPANQIKLDQRFIRRIIDDPRALAIIAGNLSAARLLDLSVIAEGVESSDHGELLLQLGCRHAQGFAIARPMPVDEFNQWTITWHPPLQWQRWRQNHFTQEDIPFLMSRTAHRFHLDKLCKALSTPANPDHPFLETADCQDVHSCPMTKWMEGSGQRYKNLRVWSELNEAHKRAHKQALRTVLTWQTGNQTAIDKALLKLKGDAAEMDHYMRELARKIGIDNDNIKTAHF